MNIYLLTLCAGYGDGIMSPSKFNLKMVTNTIDTTLKSLEKGKNQMFLIMDGAKKERDHLKEEEKLIQIAVSNLISEVDKLEAEYKKSKTKLVEVSRIFSHDNEIKIKEAYDYTNKLQGLLLVNREKEASLRKQRDELVRRIKTIEETVVQAETAVAQFGAVYSYLTGNLKHLDDVVKNAEQKLQFGIRIIQAQEDERLRIAREIHDGPAQTMANLIVRTELVERIASKDISLLKDELKEFKQTVRDSVEEVRGIIYDLRPMALDDLGLIPTLRKYIDLYKDRFSMDINFVVLGNSQNRIESSVEVAFFRILQECLTNIRKHAKATSVKVYIEFISKKIVMRVQDDGVGFIVPVDPFINERSFGLIGIKERLELLNGYLSIDSKPLQGTKITATVEIP